MNMPSRWETIIQTCKGLDYPFFKRIDIKDIATIIEYRTYKIWLKKILSLNLPPLYISGARGTNILSLLIKFNDLIIIIISKLSLIIAPISRRHALSDTIFAGVLPVSKWGIWVSASHPWKVKNHLGFGAWAGGAIMGIQQP